MVSLLDIVGSEAPDHVTLRGEMVPVTGVPAAVIARIMRDVPVIAKAAAAGGDVDLVDLLTTAPEAVAMVIAAGLGHYGEAEYEQAANKLSVDEQLTVLLKIFEVTFPGGIGPFAARLKPLAAAAGAAVNRSKAPGTKSR